jgi:hypothetical protein
MKSLQWHHVHITISNREAAAKWHEKHSPAQRTPPTKRSENLYCGPNLLQIQSKAVAPEPSNGRIESIGIGVLNLNETVTDWKSAGGFIDNLTSNTAKVRDPWGVPFELVESSKIGYTHLNIAVLEPKKLFSWYELNLGGSRKQCEWDDTRLVLEYDTMFIMFISLSSAIITTTKRFIDHLGWYTEDLDKTYQRLSGNGVHFPVFPRKYGPVRLAFAEDSIGNWIEILEPPNGSIRKSS